jgi:hypothetical protein
MDVFRFARVPRRANDPTRRYRILSGEAGEDVGEVQVAGDARAGDPVVLTVTCGPVLSDSAREDALGTARRFLHELATGWGVPVAEAAGGGGWEEQVDGSSRIRLEYRVDPAHP